MKKGTEILTPVQFFNLATKQFLMRGVISPIPEDTNRKLYDKVFNPNAVKIEFRLYSINVTPGELNHEYMFYCSTYHNYSPPPSMSCPSELLTRVIEEHKISSYPLSSRMENYPINKMLDDIVRVIASWGTEGLVYSWSRPDPVVIMRINPEAEPTKIDDRRPWLLPEYHKLLGCLSGNRGIFNYQLHEKFWSFYNSRLQLIQNICGTV